LSADSLLVRSAEFNTRCGITAIQIVSRATPIGAAIDLLPASQVYTGGRASFRASVAGVVPFTYQWQKNGAPLSNGGNISGSTNATLNITGVSAPDAGNYSVIVSNASGIVTSTVAPLTVTAPTAGSFAEGIFTNNPVAYWRLNETGDPSTNNSPAYDSVGGFNAIYGPRALNGFNGIVGPQPPDFPGFEAGNSALQTFSSTTTPLPYPSSYVSWAVAPPLNLNTNTVTLCAWIYPAPVVQAGSCGIIFERTGTDTSGFGYGANNNLGYTWNAAANTFGFAFGSPGYPELGLAPPSNQWSFVACVITPTNAILYLLNTNGQFSATNTVAHANGAWANATMIGDDPNSTGTPQNRAFTGSIDEVAVFNRSLAPTELYGLYKKGLQISAIRPVIAAQPVSLALLQGRNARFAVTASGETSLTYQWRTNGFNITDGGNVSGAASASLTVTGVTFANAANYDVVVANIAGSITSSIATLTVVASNTTPTPYEAKLRAGNPIAYWRLNEASGSPYSYDYWGGNILANTSVTLGVPGPVPPNYSGIESTNTAGQYDGLSSYTASTASLMNNLAQFSVIGWFNTAGPIGQRVGLFGQNDVVEFGFHGLGSDGTAQVGVFTPRGSAFLNQSTNVLPGVWYLIAAVGTGTNVNLYLASTNGAGGVKVLQSSTTHAATTNYGAAQFPFRIGGGGVLDPGGNFFTGIIDEVAVFNRAISVDELSGLFGAALSGGDLPPTISADPVSQTLYAGRTATFSVSALGTSPRYQWRTNGVRVANNGSLSGATTATLTITNISAANQALYDVVITNGTGSVTSLVATLTVITPLGGYEASVIALNPIAYYSLNETNDPSTGTAVANDYWGGHNGLYGIAALNGFNGVAGPTNPPFPGFESTNAAVQTTGATPNSFVTAPVGSLSINTVTFTAWLYPVGIQESWSGLLVNRGVGVTGGFNYNDQQMLGYTWNNNNAATYGFASGLVIPTNQWSFVAVVVTPSNAVLYLYNTTTALSATNTLAHTADVFGNNWQIGHDNNSGNNNGTRTFNGVIDNVAIFDYAFTPTQIQNLFLAASSISLSIQRSGGNIILTWSRGILLEADEAIGPYSTNNAASPFTFSPAAAKKFYRLQIQ
jgi:hypothetical protein